MSGPSILDLGPGCLSEHGKRLCDWCDEIGLSEVQALAWLLGMPPIMGGSGFSQYAEAKIVDHANGKTSWTMPTHSYVALATSVPTSTSTGTTLADATYTTYARVENNANWTAATAATPSVGVNTATITFPACTASSSTITAWGICDALTVGNLIWWGTATSTVISTTQTPPTIAASGLSVQLT